QVFANFFSPAPRPTPRTANPINTLHVRLGPLPATSFSRRSEILVHPLAHWQDIFLKFFSDA
ncbi:hypothetical protein, partial [Pandoraea sp.]|uniref:hypothetical protein n=1 Tax=Pandoraea sp. TaxID=1883445 RepID=UPI0025E314CE